jgi:2-polyprenyl-3-methyl-5-hydroxy-6-metoxy-1,4-benzoquinol methylase
MAPLKETVPGRLEREAHFHDATFSGDLRKGASKFYAITRTSRAEFAALLLRDVAGLKVLEYGCGLGSHSVSLATAGAAVTGIDISPFAISQASEQAVKMGVGGNAQFAVMNAEQTTFPDGSFDRVCGTGILHHLDLRACYGEICRLLKPGGQAFFSEPMGHNPLINLYRSCTPAMRTPDEHPLRWADLQLAEDYFGSVEKRFYHCLDIGVVPFRNFAFFEVMHSAVAAVDRSLMAAIPPFRRMAWQVTLILSK